MKTLLFFALLTATSLLMCITTFALTADNGNIAQALALCFAINFPLCLALSILDYYVICSIKNKHAWHIAVDWLITSAIGLACSALVNKAVGTDTYTITNAMSFIVWNSIVVFAIELYIYHNRMAEKETLLARMEKEKAAYKYEALKNQIDPHFLFNSLNALASLAYQDAEKTNIFAKELSHVYRYLLTTYERQLVTLDEELDFLRSYLYLEDIRFGAALKVSISTTREYRRRMIVPAALQMLVSNALKHNISTLERPLNIRITANCGSIVVSNNLQVRNEVASTRVGLANLRKQYQMHGKDISVERDGDTFSVTLPLL